jgi:hypothetical protein
MRPLKKGTLVYWTDPDGGVCSQYATVASYLGDGMYQCKTAKGGELEALHQELRTVNGREADLVKGAMSAYAALTVIYDLRTDLRKDISKALEPLSTTL